MSRYIMGLDAGTSVVKAAMFDLEGNELSRAPSGRSRSTTRSPTWPRRTCTRCGAPRRRPSRSRWAALAVKADELLGLSVHRPGRRQLADRRRRQSRCDPAILWTDGRAGQIIDGWYADGTISEAFHDHRRRALRRLDLRGAALAAGEPGRPRSAAAPPTCGARTGSSTTSPATPRPIRRTRACSASTSRTRDWSDSVLRHLRALRRTRTCCRRCAPRRSCAATSRATPPSSPACPRACRCTRARWTSRRRRWASASPVPATAWRSIGTAGIVTVATERPRLRPS